LSQGVFLVADIGREPAGDVQGKTETDMVSR
jgi:hypothetical protein